MEVTFYVATNDGNALLSCKSTLMLGLIQPRTRLDYLPPRASLISRSADHPKKTKATLHVQKQEVSAQTTMQAVAAQNTKIQKRGPQANNKQRSDSAWVPRCFWGDWHLPRTILSHPDGSNCSPQANTLMTNPCTFKRGVQARNKQDVRGRSTCTCKWNYPLDQQLHLAWEQGQIRDSQITYLLGSNQLKQGNYKRALSLQYTWRYCTSTSWCMHYDSMQLWKKGYWHQKLDEASSFLTTFNTEIADLDILSCHLELQ